MKIEIAQIITQIISFLVILWVLKKYAWKPLLAIMEKRKEVIEEEFKDIAEEKKKIHSLLEEYQSKINSIDHYAKELKEKEIEEGKLQAQKVHQEAVKEARELIKTTKEDLQQEIAKAKAQLKEEIVDMALAATEKILDQKMAPEKQKKIVSDFAQQMESH